MNFRAVYSGQLPIGALIVFGHFPHLIKSIFGRAIVFYFAKAITVGGWETERDIAN